jgi:glycosyltransferase involved in cell wall biosynthesis
VHRRIRSFDRITRFFAVSEFVRRKHVESGMRPSRIVVKPNFVAATERRVGPGDGYVAIGRLSAEKGIAEVVRAWPKDTPLEIYGDGPERRRVARYAGPAVRLMGEITPSKLASVLSRARALVFPSRSYEAQPRSILEAFAAGVPVIASRVGGLPELIEDGVNGVLVDPDHAQEWRGAVRRITDAAESVRLGEGAYLAWRERFSPEVGLRRLLEAYQDAIVAHRDHPRGEQ